MALLLQAADKRCDSVVHTGVEPMVLQWVRAAQQTKVLAGVPTIFLTPAYTERVAVELRASALPIYCMAEFEPWSSRSMSLTDRRAVMRRGNPVPAPSRRLQKRDFGAHVRLPDPRAERIERPANRVTSWRQWLRRRPRRGTTASPHWSASRQPRVDTRPA
jgi:hypothetical protein